jgi:hypothetical protein
MKVGGSVGFPAKAKRASGCPSLLEWLSATTENGSDWQIAIGDWKNSGDVGVAISHDGKRQPRQKNGSDDGKGGEWRMANGE